MRRKCIIVHQLWQWSTRSSNVTVKPHKARVLSFGSHCTTRLIQTPELCHGRIEYTIHQLLGDLATCQARTSSKPVERLYGILDTWKIQISTSLQSSNLSWKGRTSEVDRRMALTGPSRQSVWSCKVFIPSRFVVLAITSNSCMGWWSWRSPANIPPQQSCAAVLVRDLPNTSHMPNSNSLRSKLGDTGTNEDPHCHTPYSPL